MLVTQQQPPRPDLSAGWCARLASRDWWTSEDPDERRAARQWAEFRLWDEREARRFLRAFRRMHARLLAAQHGQPQSDWSAG